MHSSIAMTNKEVTIIFDGYNDIACKLNGRSTNRFVITFPVLNDPLDNPKDAVKLFLTSLEGSGVAADISNWNQAVKEILNVVENHDFEYQLVIKEPVYYICISTVTTRKAIFDTEKMATRAFDEENAGKAFIYHLIQREDPNYIPSLTEYTPYIEKRLKRATDSDVVISDQRILTILRAIYAQDSVFNLVQCSIGGPIPFIAPMLKRLGIQIVIEDGKFIDNKIYKFALLPNHEFKELPKRDSMDSSLARMTVLTLLHLYHSPKETVIINRCTPKFIKVLEDVGFSCIIVPPANSADTSCMTLHHKWLSENTDDLQLFIATLKLLLNDLNATQLNDLNHFKLFNIIQKDLAIVNLEKLSSVIKRFEPLLDMARLGIHIDIYTQKVYLYDI